MFIGLDNKSLLTVKWLAVMHGLNRVHQFLRTWFMKKQGYQNKELANQSKTYESCFSSCALRRLRQRLKGI
jgi:hypothetical protein